MGLSTKLLVVLCFVGFACNVAAVDEGVVVDREDEVDVYLQAGINKNEFQCEELPTENCAFAVSSSGARCVLETNVLKNGEVELECQSSDVVTDKFSSWIESASCIKACGLNQMSVGMSTDFLGEKDLQRSICSASCIDVCPNLEELFTMLASGEGVGLRSLCDAYIPAPVVLAVNETTADPAASDDGDFDTAANKTTSTAEDDAAAADSTTTDDDTSAITVPAIPRKLIQTTVLTKVNPAEAPAAAEAYTTWSADRRMLYNLLDIAAVAPTPSAAVLVNVPAPATPVAAPSSVPSATPVAAPSSDPSASLVAAPSSDPSATLVAAPPSVPSAIPVAAPSSVTSATPVAAPSSHPAAAPASETLITLPFVQPPSPASGATPSSDVETPATAPASETSPAAWTESGASAVDAPALDLSVPVFYIL